MAAFAAWHAENQELLNERTYASQWVGARPKDIRSSRKWWYTNVRLRSAYQCINKALQRGHLFTFLDEELKGLGINATTNMIEGAVNSGIRAMIFYHRGMPLEHRRRACEWFCWTHTAAENRPALGGLLRPKHGRRPWTSVMMDRSARNFMALARALRMGSTSAVGG